MTEKIKNLSFLINIAFAVLIVISASIFMNGIISNKYIIKTLTSALFVFCGMFNFSLVFLFKKEMLKKTIIMLVGLFFAFFGDVLLIDHFVIGAIFFAIGHLFFFAYFVSINKIKAQDFIISFAIFAIAVCLILFYDGFSFNGMIGLVLVYAFIISLMLGKAISGAITKPTLANIIMAIGAFLFFFSDLMLLFDVFAQAHKIFDVLCLSTYYPAEFLLALCISLQTLLSPQECKQKKVENLKK